MILILQKGKLEQKFACINLKKNWKDIGIEIMVITEKKSSMTHHIFQKLL